jgi:hypothetical protein
MTKAAPPQQTTFCPGLIYNEGSLTLMRSTVSGNTAGDGGGIANDGTLTLSSSTVSGNTAGDGGGIYNSSGRLTLTGSSVSGNTASQDGGGIDNIGSLNVTNSTIANNKAMRGGGIAMEGFVDQPTHATLTFCTLYGNTASIGSDIGIFDQNYQGNPLPHQISLVTLRNSIVLGPSTPDMQGRFISKGYNLFLANSGATFDPKTQALHAMDKMVSVQDLSKVFVTTPAQLSENGGPTMTLALLSDPANPAANPAVDTIPLDACQVDDGTGHKITTDQREKPRPDDGELMCDIGAYES